MSEKYYRKLCDQLLVQINNTSYNFVDKEILRRDFVSRLYYTGLLHCTTELELTSIQREGSHNTIINAIAKEYSFNMIHLKKLRKDADYDTTVFPEPLKFKGQEAKLQRLLAVVDDILQQNKASLVA